ncbi:MAG: hypothetical protein AABX74_04615 [Nanoarchaeota archaeon]
MAIEATHNKILEYLKKHGSANTFRLSKHLGIDRIELIRLIDELAKKGLAKFKSGVVTGFKEDKKLAEKILSDASSDKEFRFCNGLHIKNLHELLLAFETIEDDVYQFHANNEKNDFSSWIKDVFEDEELASNLRMKDREEVIGILNDRIDYLRQFNY